MTDVVVCCGKVSWTRDTRNVDETKRRRRECSICGRRWWTFEVDKSEYDKFMKLKYAIQTLVQETANAE